MNNRFKVVIPCAGIGSRVGPYTSFMNKALISLGPKPVVAHIIEYFDPDVEIIILLGYKGNLIKQTVSALFPERKINYVDVDRYTGEGSGLGYSLLKAKSLLQCPFVFISNDTIAKIDNFVFDPTTIGNWLAYYTKHSGDEVSVEQYRTVELENGMVSAILPKAVRDDNIYIGLCGVKNYEEFWNAMEEPDAIVIGEAHGLKALKKITAVNCADWNDTGSMSGLRKAKTKFKMSDINILEKEDEAIWFINNKVIKFHVDQKFISDRVERFNFIDTSLLPRLTEHTENLYVYEKENGKVLSKCINNLITKNVLEQINTALWSQKSTKDCIDFRGELDKFYRVKTIERIKYFLERFEYYDNDVEINGYQCPAILDLIDDFDWEDMISNAIIARFHGDFHSENILYDSGKIKLLDWRQNFGDIGKEFGDVNYDLAKFLHGLIVSHDEVDKGNFKVEKNGEGKVTISISRPSANVDAEAAFYEWCDQENYNVSTIKKLTALIFLNISGLHEYPYSEFLFFLGRYLLQKELSGALVKE